MNGTRGVLGIAVVAALCFMACNYTDGECFPREELYETSGVGGGVIVPTGVGVGGYGSVPFEPLSAPPEPDGPVCNIVSGGPCDDKCQAEYDLASIECGKIEDSAQRRACQDKAHVSYKACQEDCEQNVNKACLAKWNYCADKAPSWCTKVWNKRQFCTFCYEECMRGADPSSDCVKCGF